MSSRHHSDEDAFGNDSFLDVVCNMVGIVIILVMVVGTRAQVTMRPEEPKAPKEIEELSSKVTAITAELLRQAGQVDAVRLSMVARNQERDRLAQVAALKRRELEAARRKLDEQARSNFDVQRAAREAEQEIERLQQAIGAAQTKQETVKVVSYPTPISSTVDGAEGHFQVRGGRVVHIPLERLIVKLKDDARQKVWKLRDRDSITETLSPVDGFRLVYTLGKHEVPLRQQIDSGTGSLVTLDEWTLVPTSGVMGETVEEALAPTSQFRSAIAQYDPKRVAVTLWVYPDSFGAYRKLKEELYKQGYKTAGRPLPEGVPISGSPEGSKSSAQ